MSHVEDLASFARRVLTEHTPADVTASQEDATEARSTDRSFSLGVELVAAHGASARARAAESYRRVVMAKACSILRALAEEGRLDEESAGAIITGVGGALDRLADAVSQDDVYEELAAIEDAERLLAALHL